MINYKDIIKGVEQFGFKLSRRVSPKVIDSSWSQDTINSMTTFHFTYGELLPIFNVHLMYCFIHGNTITVYQKHDSKGIAKDDHVVQCRDFRWIVIFETICNLYINYPYPIAWLEPINNFVDDNIPFQVDLSHLNNEQQRHMLLTHVGPEELTWYDDEHDNNKVWIYGKNKAVTFKLHI